MKMRHGEAETLRHRCADLAGSRRHLYGRYGSVALGALAAGGSAFAGRLGELCGRSVLLVVREQLNAAVALIELDGVARRIVICTPDVPLDHMRGIAVTADVDAVVYDEGTPDRQAFGVSMQVACDASGVAAHSADVREFRQTEWVLLTSGTTGVPKLVSHTLASLIAPIKPVAEPPIWGTFYDIRRYGGMQIFLRALVGGGSLILSSAGEPVAEPVAEHLGRLAAHGATHVSGTPSHWWRVLMGSEAGIMAPRYVRLSGEIANQAVLDGLRAAYPQAGVGHAFASTEAGVGFEVNDALEGFPADFLGIGRGDVDIAVDDGVLRLRSPRTASEYIGAGAAPLRDADDFVDTGDLVELRGARYHFVGRKDGVINVGGLKVHPEEVEATINSHAGVSGSLVRSRKSPITGAIVVADVVLKADGAPEARPVLEREIIALCRRDLAAYKVPAMIRFVSTLPMTAAGKLQRHA
jgi:acyl-coenzyme A synthetase/AMP-(fatty) acid ligase